MSPAARIAAFAGLLAACFALAAVAGAQLDPEVDEAPAEHEEEGDMNEHAKSTDGASGRRAATATAGLPGLAVENAGYQLIPEDTMVPASPGAAYAFRIVDDHGETVRDFDVEHERRMHLIIVRRDFAHFQHLHPRQRDDGTWVAEADLSAGGVYRAFADFATAGESLTLAADVFVPGSFDPVPPPEPARTADAGDGYEVTLASSDDGRVRFTVSRHGEPVTGVEPYLGADGHLVALREHDQAFLHVHPEGEPGGVGPIVFTVEYPSAGNYRLFLQFKHGGEVHTAAFTTVAEGAAEERSDGDH